MSPRYNAMSRNDMRVLATALIGVPKTARPALAARVVAEGIMLPTQRWVRFSVWLAKKRHGVDTYTAWVHLFIRAPQIADDLIGQLADWIVSGKEADGKGVGGLHQGEVDALELMLTMIRPSTGGAMDGEGGR